MMKKFSFLIFFLVFSMVSYSASKKVIEEKLKNLSETLQEKKIDYRKIRQQYKDLLAQIRNTDSRIRMLRIEINKTNQGISKINKKISLIDNEIGKVSAKLYGQRKKLQGELKGYYEYSLVSPYYKKGIWFAYMNGYVTTYMQNRIKDYINRRIYLKRRISQLNKLKEKKERLRNEIKLQQVALKKQKDTLNRLAALANSKKLAYLNEIKRITKQQERLKNLLKKIIEEEKRKAMLAKRRRRKVNSINRELVVKEFSVLAKRIPPPVKGKLVDRFGRKYDPLFKVYTRNDGIDIRAKRGSCVRSIAYGRVDYVGNLPGYGGVVIINHLNGYYTVYGGVKSLLKVGDVVKAYKCIGRLQSTKLHFEIRRHATPLNPLNYINRRLLK